MQSKQGLQPEDELRLTGTSKLVSQRGARSLSVQISAP